MRTYSTHLHFVWLILTVLPIFSGQSVLLAQDLPGDSKIDSIQQLIAAESVDSIKYTLYHELYKELVSVDRAASIGPLRGKLKLAERLDDASKIATTVHQIGSQYMYIGETDSASVYLLKADSLFREVDDIYGLNDNLNNLALIYQRTNKYEEAVEAYQGVITNSDSLGDYIGEVFALANLMTLFMDLKDYERALDYSREIESVINGIPAEETDVINEMKDYYSGIYLNIGQCYDELSELDSAMIYFNLANDRLSDISNEYAQLYYQGYIQNSVGENHYKKSLASSMGDTSEWYLGRALEYFQKANASFTSLSDSRGEASSLNNIGKTFNKLGSYSKANEQLNAALALAKSINFQEQIRDSYQHLAENSDKRNDYKRSNEYLKQWIVYRDSIRNSERDKITRGLEVRFETAKKEKENTELALENERSARQKTVQRFIFIGSLLLLLGIVYIIFSRLNLKKQKEKVEFEKSVNQAMSRFVPMAFIKAIGRDKITDVQLGDQTEKEVTVVFTDIRSFTTLSERMTPRENFAFVKEYAERMGPIIEKNNGFISQYLGDGIMAIFQEGSTDALNACIEMQQDINEYNVILSQRGLDKIKVGMGLHTGPLIMGIIGDETRRDATLISDTVNTAARIESTTKELKADILLSENSVKNLKVAKKFNLSPRGEISVKGKTIPIQVYECMISSLQR